MTTNDAIVILLLGGGAAAAVALALRSSKSRLPSVDEIGPPVGAHPPGTTAPWSELPTSTFDPSRYPQGGGAGDPPAPQPGAAARAVSPGEDASKAFTLEGGGASMVLPLAPIERDGQIDLAFRLFGGTTMLCSGTFTLAVQGGALVGSIEERVCGDHGKFTVAGAIRDGALVIAVERRLPGVSNLNVRTTWK